MVVVLHTSLDWARVELQHFAVLLCMLLVMTWGKAMVIILDSLAHV